MGGGETECFNATGSLKYSLPGAQTMSICCFCPWKLAVRTQQDSIPGNAGPLGTPPKESGVPSEILEGPVPRKKLKI